jgi:hypothetical protein
MAGESKWGIKYTCFDCGVKFYDLNRPKAVCPKCGADQADKKAREDIAAEEVPEEEQVELPEEEEELVPAEPGEEDIPEMEEDLGYEEFEEEPAE